MAARVKYPPPHEQLLQLARWAKWAGLSFEGFWADAVRPGRPAVTWAWPEEKRPDGCVVWPRDTTDRNISIAATLGAKDGWRRAYSGIEASRGDRAIERLRPVLEAVAARAAAEDRPEPALRAVTAA